MHMNHTTIPLDITKFIIQGRARRNRRFVLVTSLLFITAASLCCAMLLLGNTLYPPETVIRVLRGETVQGATFAIRTIRLPRMLAGVFAGFAFGMAGSVFQTMLRNPLANPNIIGVTSGSSAGAVICIVLLHTSATTVYAVSVIAGLCTTLIMYLLSAHKRAFSTSRMILVGIGIQAMLNAVVSYVLLIGQEKDLPTAMRWLSGSLNGAQLDMLYPLIIITLLLTPIILLCSRPLSILPLGEEAAVSLGVQTSRVRSVLMVCAVLLTSITTAATGPIAFVSFLSGPIARRLVGHGNASPLPAGFFGAVLVLASDLIGQFAFALRFPVGVITGLLGAPYLIFLLIQMNKAGEF